MDENRYITSRVIPLTDQQTDKPWCSESMIFFDTENYKQSKRSVTQLFISHEAFLSN